MALSCSIKTALLKGITSKYHGDFYELIFVRSFATENKRKFHNKVCENKDFCNDVTPSKNSKILEFNLNR